MRVSDLKFLESGGGSIPIFPQQKHRPVVMGVSMSGFERLEHLSLPRRVKGCA
jgi:hypothetical protein